MAFESRTLVNGEWTTRTLDVNTVLRHYDQEDREANEQSVEIDRPLPCGLLTQTVIPSPLVHWILPAKVRGPDHNDVAFIGDEFVQIRELRQDGQLCDIIRREHFGSRIRNARVVGSLEAYKKEQARESVDTHIKDEDKDVEMLGPDDFGGSRPNQPLYLPPQYIILQLVSGHLIFLWLRQSQDGSLGFTIHRHRVSKAMIDMEAGTHLTVDPSGRYLCVGSTEDMFTICELSSRENLKGQYAQGLEHLRFIQSETYRALRIGGVLYKMEFLHPEVEDEEHVILLVLQLVRGKMRLFLYEWDIGDPLHSVLGQNYRGHLLEQSRQLPLLVIPLTFKSAFILIFETFMAICHDLTQATPKFVDFNTTYTPATSIHHGSGAPLWTAWTRPPRLSYHTATVDNLYIVREDGLVKAVEIDSDATIQADMNIGELGTYCGVTLASLDYRNMDKVGETGDLLITGGDGCTGATYLVLPRNPPVFIEPIHNWSPVMDFVTTSDHRESEAQSKAMKQSERSADSRNLVPNPDRIFACTGKGSKGTIMELRYGLEARIGLETEYHSPIMRAWVLDSTLGSFEDEGGTLFLLSLGASSSLLHLSSTAEDIIEVEPSSSPLDLRHGTITTSMHESCVIQVTTHSVVFVKGNSSLVYDGEALFNLFEGKPLLSSGKIIENAMVYNSTVLFTTRSGNKTFLRVLGPDAHEDIAWQSHHKRHPPARLLGTFAANVTCLSMCEVQGELSAVVAEWAGSSVSLMFIHIDSAAGRTVKVPQGLSSKPWSMDGIISIAAASRNRVRGMLTLLCGTRNGVLTILDIDEINLEVVDFRYVRYGTTPVTITKDEYAASLERFFINCDSKLYSITLSRLQKSGIQLPQQQSVLQVWATDAANAARGQPAIDSMARLRPCLLNGENGGLLLVSGPNLLLTGLRSEAGAVPRHLPIGGTPSRLLYSHTLGVIVIAAQVNRKSTLLFIEPETGEDLSSPVDKNKKPVEFASGLGDEDARTYCLLEWTYVKDGKTWQFVIVSTSNGRLLIMSMDRERTVSRDGPSRLVGDVGNGNTLMKRNTSLRIRYWTRYKFKCPEPVYSVCGYADGLFYCAGNMLYCQTLDNEEKKFKKVAEYELPSPARSLVYEDGNVFALTDEHSLEIIRFHPDHSGGMDFTRTHGDQVTRVSVDHHISGRILKRPIHLVSDLLCSVVGLWPTHSTKADTLEPVFEAQLPYSVKKFRSGNCRPIWDPVWTFQSALAAVDEEDSNAPILTDTNLHLIRHSWRDPEILGMAIDGSLAHFTLLTSTSWRFLRFLVNLAKRSQDLFEATWEMEETFALEPATDPKNMMHVDGDILKRILKRGLLEKLLQIDEPTDAASKIYERFVDLLEALNCMKEDIATGKFDAGSPTTKGIAREKPSCIEQAYRYLEFYLRPVL